MNNKKIQIWLPLLFSITMIVGMYLGYLMRDNMPGKSFFYTEKRHPVQEVIDLIKNKYVDDINTNNLADTAIQAICSKLDPHSVFIPAKNLQSINEDLSGKFYGVGIEYNVFDDTINVVNVIKDGPSFKAGIFVGDKIIKVNDSIVMGKNLDVEKVHTFLRGDKGEKVTITILRNNQLKNIKIIRDAIPLSSLDASYMLTNNIGYIKLNKFSQQTYHEFMDAIIDLKKHGLKKLILDLRDNGGGILEEATEIADEFLAGDKLITYTEGKHTPKKEYRCRREGQFETGELVVILNEGTASASEVLIGALQDWDRATIIGRRSFGKGLVQEQFELSDNSALRLTIARYFTPLGRSIQRPYNNGSKAYYQEINNRYHDGETQFADVIKNDSTKLFTTNLGKKVFGGGGISPDFFIALDTNDITINISKIYTKGIISHFAYKYYLQNVQLLKTFNSASDFTNKFILTDADWSQFCNTAAKDSIVLKNIPQKEKNNLQNKIKSSIARQIWRTEGMVEVLNTDDDNIKKALEILQK